MAALTALAAASVDRLELARRASVDADCTTREFDGSAFDLPAALDVFTKCKLLVVRRAFSPEVFGDVRREFERFMRGQLSGRVAATGTTTDGERFYQHPIGAEGADDRREVLLPPSFARAELADHPLLQPLLSDGAVLVPAPRCTPSAPPSRERPRRSTGTPTTLRPRRRGDAKGRERHEALGLAGHDLPGAYAVTMPAPLSNLTARHGPTQFCVGSSHPAERAAPGFSAAASSHRHAAAAAGRPAVFDYQLMHHGGPNDSTDARSSTSRRTALVQGPQRARPRPGAVDGEWWEASGRGRTTAGGDGGGIGGGPRRNAVGGARGGGGGVRAWWAAQEEASSRRSRRSTARPRRPPRRVALRAGLGGAGRRRRPPRRAPAFGAPPCRERRPARCGRRRQRAARAARVRAAQNPHSPTSPSARSPCCFRSRSPRACGARRRRRAGRQGLEAA